MAPNQSVFAFCSWPTLAGAYCSTAARNCCALSIEGSRVIREADTEPVYSNFSRLALLAPLGRDQHDAVGGVGAVDGRGAGVAQHGHAGDVVGVEEVERIAAGGDTAAARTQRLPVDDVERLVAGVGGGAPANPDGGPPAGLVVLHDLHARHLVLDQLGGGDDAALVELLRGHVGHARR